MADERNSKQEAIERSLAKLDWLERKLINRGEVKELPNILWEDEIVERLITGSLSGEAGKGVLVATDRRLIFVDKGMFGRLHIEDFSYDQITAVESSTGLLSGSITIYSAGSKQGFGWVDKERCRDFADHLRNKLTPASERAPTTTTSIDMTSIADELAKLGALVEKGLLTQAEFDEQKKRLLA